MQAGVGNEDMQSAAVKMLADLADIKDLGLSTLAHLFTQPVESQADWHPVHRRLQLISALLGKFGISKGPSLQGGFDVNSLMTFIGTALGSPNGNVQDAALKLSVQVR